MIRRAREGYLPVRDGSHVVAVAERSQCATCGTVETMEHILVHCRNLPTRIIWRLAKDIWPYQNIPWPDISIGTILGCGCLSANKPVTQNEQQDRNRTHLQGATRLLQILISESAFLIWALRCERVIQGKTHSQQEIRAKWLREINTRLTDDRITATKVQRNKGFTKLVENTWEHVLHREGDLPNEWLNSREVLVGSRAR